MSDNIDSNLTGLRYAEEDTLGVLPGSGVIWYPLEPNSYGDFGGSTTNTPRTPITSSRQRQKGVVTDKDASAAFEQDLTLDNMYNLLQGFMFADWRKKDTDTVTAVVDGGVSADEYTVASGGTDYLANDLILASGFSTAANNGVKVVTGNGATKVTVATGSLVAEASPPADAQVHRVGFQFAAGDATITVTAGVTELNATTKNLTQLGLIPGEWIFIGGDSAGTTFATAADYGFCRVATIAASKITFDKTQNTFVADNGATKTVRIFIGDVLKNESDPDNIVQRSYHLERSLSTAGYEYVKGAVPNELSIQLSTAAKVTVNMSFVGTDTATEAFGDEYAGSRPDIATSNVAFNTSSDFSRLRLEDTDETGLASFLMEASVKINNGVSPQKALGTLGACDVSVGDFAVSGNVTAYFNTLDAVAAVKNNTDVSLDFVLATDNTGMLFDIPLLSLGGGRLQVEKNAKIKLPLTGEAAAHATLDHTMLVNSFAYLPDLAL